MSPEFENKLLGKGICLKCLAETELQEFKRLLNENQFSQNQVNLLKRLRRNIRMRSHRLESYYRKQVNKMQKEKFLLQKEKEILERELSQLR